MRPDSTSRQVKKKYTFDAGAQLLARDSNSRRRVCLMYTVINQTYSWTVGKKGCDRDLFLQAGGHKFTTIPSHFCISGEQPLSAGWLLVFVSMLFMNFNKR